MKLKVKQDFAWAHGGVTVINYVKGQVVETEDADLIEVSTREKWAAKQGAAQDANTDPAKIADPVVDAVADAPSENEV